MAQQLISHHRDPNKVPQIVPSEAAVARSEKNNPPKSKDNAKFASKAKAAAKLPHATEKTVNLSEEDLPQMIEEEVEDPGADLLSEASSVMRASTSDDHDLQAIAERAAAPMKRQGGDKKSSATSVAPSTDMEASEVTERTDVTRSPFASNAAPSTAEAENSIETDAVLEKPNTSVAVQAQATPAHATTPTTQEKLIDEDDSGHDPEDEPSFLTKREMTQSRATMNAALDAFVDEAKSWSHTSPNPLMDDRKLSELARSPMQNTAATAVATQSAAKGGNTKMIIGFLLGGLIAFGAAWAMGLGQSSTNSAQNTESATNAVTTSTANNVEGNNLQEKDTPTLTTKPNESTESDETSKENATKENATEESTATAQEQENVEATATEATEPMATEEAKAQEEKPVADTPPVTTTPSKQKLADSIEKEAAKKIKRERPAPRRAKSSNRAQKASVKTQKARPTKTEKTAPKSKKAKGSQDSDWVDPFAQ